MYDEIQQIPSSFLSDEMNLFIIPTIFLNKQRILKKCNSIKGCVRV